MTIFTEKTVQAIRAAIILTGIIAFGISISKCSANQTAYSNEQTFWPPDMVPHPMPPGEGCSDDREKMIHVQTKNKMHSPIKQEYIETAEEKLEYIDYYITQRYVSLLEQFQKQTSNIHYLCEVSQEEKEAILETQARIQEIEAILVILSDLELAPHLR